MSRTMLVYHYPKCRTFELAGNFPNGKGAWWFSNVLGFWLTLAAYVAGVFLSLVVTGGSSWTVLAVVREQLICIYIYILIHIYVLQYILYAIYYVLCTMHIILYTLYYILITGGSENHLDRCYSRITCNNGFGPKTHVQIGDCSYRSTIFIQENANKIHSVCW